MSKKFVFKKAYSNFHPAFHWNIILFASLGFLILSVAYTSYLYVYAKNEINSPVDGVVVQDTSAPALSSGSPDSVKGIENAVEAYRQKQARYSEIMTTIWLSAPVIRATTSIATSSNR
jgi:hypothetical protein